MKSGASVQRERVTEAEMVELIRRSTGGRFVDFGFGPSGAWLQSGEHNDWARDALKELRSEPAK
jgi:hypothetical protein